MSSAKRIAAKKMNVGVSKLKVDPSAAKKVKEAITGQDVTALIKEGIFATSVKGQSRGRARKLQEKKKRGRRKGQGTRKGTKNSRTNKRDAWIVRARSQRKYILILLKENKVDKVQYRDLYRKIKGGFFRSKGHIDSYLNKK
jgi:large subunit ribosomal protein L19e